MVKNIGIIGFGRFGQLVASKLKDYFIIFASDCKDKSIEAEKIGVNFTDVKECAKKDIVLLCVPISKFEIVLNKISPYLKKEALVIDVCSVKEEPVRCMKELVPKHCSCIGTHPLFGPDTTKNGLKNKKIILCPINTKQLKKIKKFLEKLGLFVIITTPAEHDKQMANSLTLIHLLGRGLEQLNVRKVTMATPTHEMFIDLVNIVKRDSKQLFIDMQIFNRFAPKARKTFIKELIKIDGELDAISK